MPYATYQPTTIKAPPNASAANLAEEQDIIQALRRGDESAYRMLVCCYTPQINVDT